MMLATAVAALALPCAMAWDRWLGEPPLRVHPVVIMGRYLGWLGPRLWPLAPCRALLAGAVSWLLGAVAVGVMAWWVEGVIYRALTWAWSETPLWGGPLVLLSAAWVMGWVLKPLLAWRMLRDETSAVDAALAQSLTAGRQRLARLVSRRVDELTAPQVRESAIESLAENLNDSVVAPIFWFFLGGLPAVAVYRFANTADAMWGYRDHREWGGKWAARVDDVLGWVPARLTAWGLCLAAGHWPGWDAMRAQARVTPSPNGGWPMGTMALLLGCRLSKPNVYVLNAAQGEPAENALQRAQVLSARVAWGSAVLAAVTLAIAGGLVESPCLPWGRTWGA